MGRGGLGKTMGLGGGIGAFTMTDLILGSLGLGLAIFFDSGVRRCDFFFGWKSLALIRSDLV